MLAPQEPEGRVQDAVAPSQRLYVALFVLGAGKDHSRRPERCICYVLFVEGTGAAERGMEGPVPFEQFEDIAFGSYASSSLRFAMSRFSHWI